jgi:hypothetical protein
MLLAGCIACKPSEAGPAIRIDTCHSKKTPVLAPSLTLPRLRELDGVYSTGSPDFRYHREHAVSILVHVRVLLQKSVVSVGACTRITVQRARAMAVHGRRQFKNSPAS